MAQAESLTAYTPEAQPSAEQDECESDDSDIPPPKPRLVEHGPKIYGRINKPGSPVFPHQVRALDAIGKWLESPDTANKTAVVAMPTGSGKTGVICCLPYMLGEAVARERLENVDLGKPMLVIAPGIEILKQLEKELQPRDNNTFICKRSIIRKKEFGHVHYKVKTITSSLEISPQSLQSVDISIVNAQKGHRTSRASDGDTIYTWGDLPPELFSVVIVDEAHHLPATQWRKIIEKFKDHAKVVFFTATPFRSDKKKITDDIPETVLAYHLTRCEAIESRIIRDTNPIDLEPHTEFDQMRRVEVAMRMFQKIKDRLDEKNTDQPLPGSTKHMAILCAYDIVEAKKIVQEWNTKFPSLRAETIHSAQKEKEKEKIMKDLKGGKIVLVVIVAMLLEGFDHPPISVAAIATKIISLVKFTQFIGRAQRIVRTPDGEVEPDGIRADVISDGFFQQTENYRLFEEEALIENSQEAS